MSLVVGLRAGACHALAGRLAVGHEPVSTFHQSPRFIPALRSCMTTMQYQPHPYGILVYMTVFANRLLRRKSGSSQWWKTSCQGRRGGFNRGWICSKPWPTGTLGRREPSANAAALRRPPPLPPRRHMMSMVRRHSVRTHTRMFLWHAFLYSWLIATWSCAVSCISASRC